MLVVQVAELLQADIRFPDTEIKKDADCFKNVQLDESCLGEMETDHSARRESPNLVYSRRVSSKYLEVVSLVRSRAADTVCSVHLWLDCKCTHVYLTLSMNETLRWRRTLNMNYRNTINIS